jgi:hypothetical protein
VIVNTSSAAEAAQVAYHLAEKGKGDTVLTIAGMRKFEDVQTMFKELIDE